jgi:hypothetical protein
VALIASLFNVGVTSAQVGLIQKVRMKLNSALFKFIAYSGGEWIFNLVQDA